MKALQIGDLYVPVPIIQGGMGVGVSLSSLASAVANQGGIGVISAVAIGLLDKDNRKHIREKNKSAFRNEIRKARLLSPKGIIGANIMLAVTDFDDLFKVALDEGLDIVFIGAGLMIKKPQSVTMEEFVNSKTKIVPKISSARAAKLTFKIWDEKFGRLPDAVVIEGSKAGGHLGFKKNELNHPKPLLEIFKETKEVLKPFEQKYGIKIPVIVGGGIYSGKDIYNAMQAGADGVKMGTRFVTTEECDADIAFKMQYINAKKEDVTIIDSPVGLPGRAIENDFIREIRAGQKKPVKCGWKCLKTCNYKEVPYCIAEALFNAAQGHLDKGFAFAGSNAYRATKIQTVKEVFDELQSEYAIAQIEKTFNPEYTIPV
jgi:nitronate monooxygenase